MNYLKKLLSKPNVIEYSIVLVAFSLYFIWSLFLPVEQAPDEWMRYLVPKYIYNHGCLPKGNEKEIMNDVFGFSYAFTPYGPSLISAFFMKAISFLSQNERILIIASRVTSVLAGTGTIIYCLKIGNLIFENKRMKYLFAILVGYLPQFVFLSSYSNNDVFAVFTSTIIFFYWIKGMKNLWDIKSCIGLGVAIGLCALTYFNAYGFILCSIFVFCFSILFSENIEHKWKFLFLRGGIVFFIAFLIAGWFFIRNFIIHNGDFLGMNSMYASGELYGDTEWKLSNRPTFKNQSLSVLDLLFHTTWIPVTLGSFFAVFGCMNISVSPIFYAIYFFLLLYGVCTGIKVMYSDKAHTHTRLFLINCLLVIIIPVVLSIRYSYAYDYQAQGRYLMSGLTPIMLLVSLGFEKAAICFGNKKVCFSKIAIFIWITMFSIIFLKYCIPLCMGGIA